MLLAVFSDSHGATANMLAAVERHHPDAVAFLGDGEKDIAYLHARFPDLPLHAVRGNCDGGTDLPDSDLFELDGVRIFAAHGHNHAVRWGLDKFGTSVLCSGAALGLYGHTHQALYQEVGGIKILNPGSIGDALHPTYGLAELENGSITCRILDCKEETAP